MVDIDQKRAGDLMDSKISCTPRAPATMFGRTSQAAVSNPPAAGRSAKCGPCPARFSGICAAFNPEELTKVEAMTAHMTMRSGQTLYTEGEPAAAIFNVLSGCLKLYNLMPDGRRQIVGFALPGDFVGFTAGDHYLNSVECVMSTELCRFSGDRFDQLNAHFPNLTARLLELTTHELQMARRQMMLLGRKKPREKVASFLLNLVDRLKKDETTGQVHLHMSRADIADFLGLTIETVSRTFTWMRENKLISLKAAHQVVLLDINALAALADGEADAG